ILPTKSSSRWRWLRAEANSPSALSPTTSEPTPTRRALSSTARSRSRSPRASSSRAASSSWPETVHSKRLLERVAIQNLAGAFPTHRDFNQFLRRDHQNPLLSLIAQPQRIEQAPQVFTERKRLCRPWLLDPRVQRPLGLLQPKRIDIDRDSRRKARLAHRPQL